MKRKWQISDISQLNLLPFRDKNDEEKGTGLDFIFEPRNDPSSWLQNASKICCINITISFAAVVSSLVRWPKVAMQSVTLQENPSGLKKKNTTNVVWCSHLSLHNSFEILHLWRKTKPQCKGFPSFKHIPQKRLRWHNFTDRSPS